MRPFKQHLLAGPHLPVEQEAGIGHVGPQFFSVDAVAIVELVEVQGFFVQDRLQIGIFLFDIALEFLLKRFLFEQIDNANAHRATLSS